VVQRTRELGICLAVGATAGDGISVVLGRAARLLFTGLAFRVLASVAATRILSRLLHGVTPRDSQTFALVFLLMTAVASIASYIPARRAGRIDPTVALRSD